MEKPLSLEIGDDGIALITMVNGENRFRLSTIKEWHAVLDEVLSNPAVKGLMITGSGRFFSNGIDLDWLFKQTPEISAQYMPALSELFKRVLVLPVPTVALINGHAFGGGAFLSIACDYRVMRPDRGWLCWPETALRMRFGDPLLAMFRTKIGPGHVQREAAVFAKRLTGDKAKELMLVDAVAADGAMMEVGKGFIKGALGKNGLDRTAVEQMKKDLYSDHITFSKI